MTRIPERLPAPLSERTSSSAQAVFSPQGREADVAVGGIAFRLATVSDIPQSIETIPFRKEQFDTELDPGEQSIDGWWWRRSQSSFHEGAGFLYAENSESNEPGNGFWTSEGIDVFTQGRITLLKAMASATQAAVTYSRIRLASGGSTGASAVGGGTLHTSPDADGTFAQLHAPAAKTIVDGFVSSGNFYDIASDGTLYEGTVASPGTATTWPCGDTVTRLMWGKHRLWVIGNRKLWQPDLSLAGGTAQNPKFTHPNKGWTYTCMAEGPSAMYFGGHDGNYSSIQAVTLDSGGALPTLTGAAETAVLPDGELVQELATIAGQYIGIGTSRGFRIGTMGSGGTITYGPLLVEPAGVTACTALCAQGRFFVVAFNSTEGPIAYRIDTGNPLSEGVFPYASDIKAGSAGYITSLAPASSTQLMATTSSGTSNIYYQSTTNYVSTGYIQSGRVRYRTTELKLFKYISIEHEPLNGAIQVDIIKEGGSTVPIANLTLTGQVTSEPLAINDEAVRYSSVKLTLTPSGTLAPVVNSYLLRALPVISPQRLITLPLLCFDYEQARSGQRYGGLGFAKERLDALTDLQDQALPITYQDFSDSTGGGHLVLIESMQFTQSAPAPAHQNDSTGGIIILRLRTVDV